jgi:hypothetical protein
MQSVAPARTLVGQESSDDIYKKIDNSLVQDYIEGDSYMAKVSGGGMTNARALQVRSMSTLASCKWADLGRYCQRSSRS